MGQLTLSVGAGCSGRFSDGMMYVLVAPELGCAVIVGVGWATNGGWLVRVCEVCVKLLTTISQYDCLGAVRPIIQQPSSLPPNFLSNVAWRWCPCFGFGQFMLQCALSLVNPWDQQ